MWGNRCDLSISSGKDNSQLENPLSQLGKLDSSILVDDFDKFWSYLYAVSKEKDSVRVDIVLDNAGT